MYVKVVNRNSEGDIQTSLYSCKVFHYSWEENYVSKFGSNLILEMEVDGERENSIRLICNDEVYTDVWIMNEAGNTIEHLIRYRIAEN